MGVVLYSRGRAIDKLLVIASLTAVFLGYMAFNQSSRLATVGIPSSFKPALIVTHLTNESFARGVRVIAFYLTHGYLGLSYNLETSFEWTEGRGSAAVNEPAFPGRCITARWSPVLEHHAVSRWWLDARHRTQAHVEDKIKQWKALGAEKLPTADQGRNAAWLQLAGLAVTLTAWLRHLALDGDELRLAEPKALRFRLLAVPARLTRHARNRVLKIPADWAWATDLAAAWTRLQALHPI